MTNKENLPKFQSYDGSGEISDWATTHPATDVAYWVEQILKENQHAYPMQLWASVRRSDDTSAGALKTIVQSEGNPAFQEKVWDGLKLLTDTITWGHIQNDEVEYVKNIFHVIALLKVQPLHDILVQLTDQKTLLQKNLGEEGPRLHVTALASLGAFGCNEQTVHIFERDIQEPFYAALCYRVLWKFDRKYASQYANLIREIGSHNERFPADVLLKGAGQI